MAGKRRVARDYDTFQHTPLQANTLIMLVEISSYDVSQKRRLAIFKFHLVYDNTVPFRVVSNA